MPIPKIIRDFNAFTNGDNWVGIVEEATMPTIARSTEEYSGGGMTGTIDVDLGRFEKMECEMTFSEHNHSIYGLVGKEDVPLTLRAARGNSSAVDDMVFEMRGLPRQLEPGNLKRGEKGSLKLTATLTYLKVTMGGAVSLEIDVANSVFTADGADLMSATRQALGL